MWVAMPMGVTTNNEQLTGFCSIPSGGGPAFQTATDRGWGLFSPSVFYKDCAPPELDT